MLIEELSFRIGAGLGSAPLVVNAPSVTIFVGPNNAGKSMVLREISNFCRGGNTQPSILDQLKFRAHSEEEFDAGMKV